MGLADLECAFLTYGKETGENGTPHLQGYVEFDEPLRFNSVKNMIPRAHLEGRRGTAEEAAQYCWKDDPSPYKRGKLSSERQGKRTDLLRVSLMVENGSGIKDIAKAYPKEIIKYHRGISYLINILKEPEEYRRVKVIVHYGRTGLGKTRRAVKLARKLGGAYRPNLGTKLWWDYYHGQPCVLFDDFDGSYCKYRVLLRLLDGYPEPLDGKVSATSLAEYTVVFITSNLPPREWYSHCDYEPLDRRLTEIWEFQHNVARREK